MLFYKGIYLLLIHLYYLLNGFLIKFIYIGDILNQVIYLFWYKESQPTSRVNVISSTGNSYMLSTNVINKYIKF